MARAPSNIVYLESPEKGVDGRGIYTLARDPLLSDFRIGDFVIQSVTRKLYGPKNAGGWPDLGLIRGAQGWAPKLVAETDGVRRVFKISDWTGGEGIKPATGYLADDGTVVPDIEDAVDFRGEQGPQSLIDALNAASAAMTDETLSVTAEIGDDNVKRRAVEVFDLGGILDRKSLEHGQTSNVSKYVDFIRLPDAYFQRTSNEPNVPTGEKFRSLDRWTDEGNHDSANGGWWKIATPFFKPNTILGPFWKNGPAEPTIYRMRDRVFIGDAVGMGPTRINTNTTWVPDGTTGANWAPRDSQCCVMTDNGGMAVTGMSLVSQSDLIEYRPAAIGVAGFAINDGDYDPGITNNYPTAWALYGDVQHEPVAETGNSYGLELAVKNKSVNSTANPYDRTSGAYGLWLHGGGDPVYGGVATFPNNAAIMLVRNNNSGVSAGWNVGLVFEEDSLTYTGSLAPAIRMAKGHSVEWWTPETGGAKGAYITSAVDGEANAVSQLFNDNAVSFLGVNNKPMVAFSHVANGVNYVSIVNAVTGGASAIMAAGDDTNTGIVLLPKGTSSGFLNAGNGSTRVRWNNTGLGFFTTAAVAQKTGWAPATGTATRTTFDTSTITTAQLAERVKALIDDLHSTSGYGLITN